MKSQAKNYKLFQSRFQFHLTHHRLIQEPRGMQDGEKRCGTGMWLVFYFHSLALTLTHPPLSPSLFTTSPSFNLPHPFPDKLKKRVFYKCCGKMKAPLMFIRTSFKNSSSPGLRSKVRITLLLSKKKHFKVCIEIYSSSKISPFFLWFRLLDKFLKLALKIFWCSSTLKRKIPIFSKLNLLYCIDFSKSKINRILECDILKKNIFSKILHHHQFFLVIFNFKNAKIFLAYLELKLIERRFSH